MDHQPHSPLQSTPIIQEESLDSVQQPAIDSAQEVVPDHPAYQQLLQYVEARQQVLLCNISYCNAMLEQLEQLLSVNEPSSIEAEAQCENRDQNPIQDSGEPIEDPKADSEPLQAQPLSNLDNPNGTY
ncbi:uncharacterized protein LOC144695874 [Cetorhinus maximus]